jgi:hypothetical protein
LQLDIDGDGRIPLSDLKHVLSHSSRQVALNDRQIEVLLEEADTNRDGSFDFREFALLVSSACRCRASENVRLDDIETGAVEHDQAACIYCGRLGDGHC